MGIWQGCAVAGQEDNAGKQDAGGDRDAQANQPDAPPLPRDAPPIPDAPPPDAPPPQPQPITITHSSSSSVVSGGSVSCNNNGFHSDNSYYRTFVLPALGITSDFDIDSVQIGIQTADASDGAQLITLRLHTLSGAFVLGNLTQIATLNVPVSDQTLSLLNIPIDAVIPAGSTLVVEVFTPNGQNAGNKFFIGANAQTETAPSFIRAPNCDINQPVTMATIGFPNAHVVMSVTGTHFP